MSDLDADLYGDLYGNDENEFAVPTEPADNLVKPEPLEPPQDEAPVAVNAEPSPQTTHPPLPPSSAESSTSRIQTSTQLSSTPATIPSYTSPPTQQIPTYQERQTPEYREPPQARQDGSYQPPLDRPVRPSEMKEEG
ncbi:hypothetical protein B0H21DRAFT_687434 [Amylocystis lapponica]|nr:hypothetical protein B0H21DRAFT_687434 [Amylocystis lapponica]